MPKTTTTKSQPARGAAAFDLGAIPEELRPQIEAMVPPEFVAERYVNRVLPGGGTDFDALDLAMATRHNVLLPGPTGSGKTTVLRAYAAARRLPYVSVEFHGAYDHASVIGRTVIGKDGLPDYVKGAVTLAVEYGGVVDLAEVAFAPPRFMAAFYGVLDSRQALFVQDLGVAIPKHPATLIGANYNPGYAGTVKLNEAFANRFGITLVWDYDPHVEDMLIGPYSPRLLQVVRNLRKEATVRSDIGTNRMEEFIEFATHPAGSLALAAHAFVNGFPEGERAIVAKSLEANLAAIEAELNTVDADDEDNEDNDN